MLTPKGTRDREHVSPQKTKWCAHYGRSALRAPAGQGGRSSRAWARGRARHVVAGGRRGADRGEGGGGQSVRRESRDRPEVLRGLSASARPRRGRRDHSAAI